jgi:hypothetical protein
MAVDRVDTGEAEMGLDLALRRDDPVLTLVRLHVSENLLLALREHYWTFDQYPP